MCTDASQPVIDAAWVKPGMHLSPVTGSELPRDALPSIDVLVRHLDGGNMAFRVGGEQQELDSGDPARKAETPTLADVLTAKAAGRTSDDQVTCFYNVPGSGIQFAAVGLKVYELAKARGIGRELPLDWFLEHERD